MNELAIDDEIIEIFLEEAGDVFENLDRNLPAWRKRPADKDRLTEIRRGFHTLKGSGRMVNAQDLAEVAWKIENMLNRVIDGSVQVTEPMHKLISSARNLMPKMLEAFKNRRPLGQDSEVESLIAQADALAAGKPPAPVRELSSISAVRPGGEQSMALKIAGLDRRLEHLRQRSDEALHRSELALQDVRRVATHMQAKERSDKDRVDSGELERVIERVDLLFQEVLDLRNEAQRRSSQPAANPHEISKLISQRARERVAPVERQLSELEERLVQARGAAAASRGLAWGALILSVLAAGGAVAVFLMSGVPLG